MRRRMDNPKAKTPSIDASVDTLRVSLESIISRLTPSMRQASTDDMARLRLTLDGSAERELVILQKRIDEKCEELERARAVIANFERRADALLAHELEYEARANALAAREASGITGGSHADRDGENPSKLDGAPLIVPAHGSSNPPGIDTATSAEALGSVGSVEPPTV